MSYTGRLILGMVSLLVLLGVSVSCSSGQSDSGVAQIDESQVLETPVEPAVQSDTPVPLSSNAGTSDQSTDTTELTDEEIVTLFTSCMRDLGFSIPDPELNADGTVKRDVLRASMTQNPKFATKGRAALGNCLPLLEGVTFAEAPSAEDEIELQDNVLKFAQCLRDKGYDVPDPDFSGGNSRAAMRPILADLKGPASKVQEDVDECNELYFGAGAGAGGQSGGR